MHSTTERGPLHNHETAPLAYSLTTAAALLGVDAITVGDLVQRGQLPSVRIGDHIVIARDDLLALLPPQGSGRTTAMLTVAEVADQLRCSVRHAHWLCDSGALPVVRMGRRKSVKRADLDAFIAAGGTHRVVVADAEQSSPSTSASWRRQLAERRAEQQLETATELMR